MTLRPIRPADEVLNLHSRYGRPAYSPITVDSTRGDVVITVDPGTARDLAEAWATLHAVDATFETIRPRWFDEVVDIHRAAATADLARGEVPEPVQVPLIRPTGGDRP